MSSTYRIFTFLGDDGWMNEEGCMSNATVMVDVTAGQLCLAVSAGYYSGVCDDGTPFTVTQDEEIIRVDEVKHEEYKGTKLPPSP